MNSNKVIPNDILNFVNLIARMTANGDPVGADGELLPDGTDNDFHFEMQAEDAILTLSELIATARKLLQDQNVQIKTHKQQRVYNQVLAALRLWQELYPKPNMPIPDRWSEYFEDEGYEPMTAEEIDCLCEHIDIAIPDDEKHYDWMDGLTPEEISHYWGEAQECHSCAGTDGKHHAWRRYLEDSDYMPTNYFTRDGKVKKTI